MKKIFNWKLGLILIIFLAAFLRLWQLGNVPSGIPDDEASYIYNAYSIWHTGKDINGNFLPLSFNAHSSQSPVEVYLTAPFVGVLGISEFSGRLPSALLGIGSVILLFLLTDYLFKNKRLALISALLLCVSSWALQLQRGLWDADFALFFLLFGIYVFVVNIHTRRFLWSLVPFLLGFYSYHATKVYLIFLIPVLIFFYRKELLRRKKEAVLFLSGCLLILLSFLIVVKTQTVTRQTNVSLLNDPKVAIEVNWERQYNTAPWILRTIFSNKPLYYLKSIRENYLKAFSPEYLFLSGEGGNFSAIVNIYYRGELYIIELPLLLLGIYALFKNKDKFSRNFILALLLISPLPSTFTFDSNFVDRDIMMLPILLIMVACGINYLLDKIGEYKRIYKYILLTIFVLTYLFLISGYLYQYYFRWPVYGAEAWGKSNKDLVYLMNLKKNDYKQFYISRNPYEFLLQYAIYDKVDPKIIQKSWQEHPIKLYDITLFQECINNGIDNVTKFLPKSTFYAALDQDCHYRLSTPSAKIVDKGEPLHVIWNIYENK
jgi:4-amino-4-deoxy-L-arabinose transferase-like glycosyltransferase